MSSDHEPWEPVLWRRQAYPDNHVPPSFLAGLRTNANVPPYAYAPLVRAACAITQHVATVFVFLAVFARLHTAALDPRALVAAVCAAFVAGYAAWALLGPAPPHAKALKSALLVFLALLALAPVLRTLTAASSSDSLWALAALLFALHALLADYAPPAAARRLPAVLSMNAAVSASAVLASRLASPTAVFALTLFAVQAFALFPLLRARLPRAPLAAVLAVLAVGLAAPLSRAVAALFALVLALLTFVAPAVFVWAQKFKNEIRGPWDVAVPQVR